MTLRILQDNSFVSTLCTALHTCHESSSHNAFSTSVWCGVASVLLCSVLASRVRKPIGIISLTSEAVHRALLPAPFQHCATVFASIVLTRSGSHLNASVTAGCLSFPLMFHFSSVVATSACAWSEGDVSAEHCVPREAGELAGGTCARQARPLSACTTH